MQPADIFIHIFQIRLMFIQRSKFHQRLCRKIKIIIGLRVNYQLQQEKWDTPLKVSCTIQPAAHTVLINVLISQ